MSDKKKSEVPESQRFLHARIMYSSHYNDGQSGFVDDYVPEAYHNLRVKEQAEKEISDDQLRDCAKKFISYERQMAVFGKSAADNALQITTIALFKFRDLMAPATAEKERLKVLLEEFYKAVKPYIKYQDHNEDLWKKKIEVENEIGKL